MGKKLYPLARIKYWYAYDIDEVCALYRSHFLHPQTVRKWIKQGLATIDGRRPTLIYGHNLKAFLGGLNASGKCKTQFHEMFCFSCKDAYTPYKRRVSLESCNGSLKAKAHCSACHTVMHKSYKMDDITRLKQTFRVVDVSELYDSLPSPLKTHLDTGDKKPLSASTQLELFSDA